MGRKRVVTHGASYTFGVRWIAENDNVADDNPLNCGTDGESQRECRDNIAGYISTLLLADLFGADPSAVAHDVFRARIDYMNREKAGLPPNRTRLG